MELGPALLELFIYQKGYRLEGPWAGTVKSPGLLLRHYGRLANAPWGGQGQGPGT